MIIILKLKPRKRGYIRQPLIIGILSFTISMFGFMSARADEATVLPNQANSCNGISFWELPKGQCINLNNLTLLGSAENKNIMIQADCWIASENTRPKTTAKTLNTGNVYSRAAILTVFPENWEQKQYFAIQACARVKDTEAKLIQIESTVSNWFGDVSEQVRQAYL